MISPKNDDAWFDELKNSRIATCVTCGQKNRLRQREAVGSYQCGKCHSVIQNPFQTPNPLFSIISIQRPKRNYTKIVALVFLALLCVFIVQRSISHVPPQKPVSTFPLPKNGQIFDRTTGIGMGSLKITNGTSYDARIKLAVASSRKVVADFYVKSNNTYKLDNIPDGTYQVVYGMVEGWKDEMHSELLLYSFERFDHALIFDTKIVETGTQQMTYWNDMELTLHKVINGNAKTSVISQNEFESYEAQSLKNRGN